MIYLHSDHLGSVGVSTNSAGAVIGQQAYDPWGAVRGGGVSATQRNYTGQYMDGTGLLFYNARYYDPVLARFISPDTVVPGAANGSLDGVALKPLTVGFVEPGFVATLNAENQFGPWFTLSNRERQQLGSPMGPMNPQSLNRYSYGLNNPVKYTDPTGHTTVCTVDYSACSGARVVNHSKTHSVIIVGDVVLPDGRILTNQVYRLEPGQSSISLGMVDVDRLYVDGVAIDGYGSGYSADLSDGFHYDIYDDGTGALDTGVGRFIFDREWEFDANATAITTQVKPAQGVDMSHTRHIGLLEAIAARELLKLGTGPYRDCTPVGACAFP
jgi:RHS repeat-associated protein